MSENHQKLLFELNEYQDAQKIILRNFDANDQKHYLKLKYSTHDNKFFCGYNATFGPIRRSDNITDLIYFKLLEDLYDNIVNHFNGFEIRLPPAYLDNISNNAFFKFFNNKNTEIVVENNQYIDLEDDQIFSKTNRKTLRRLQESKCWVSVDKKISLAGYDLLKRNRDRRNVKLSLGFDDLVMQSESMKDRYLFASCFDQNKKLIAYSICTKLQHDLLYVLYWGEEPSERSRSPVVLLCSALIGYAKAYSIRYLDVGISSVDGKLDESLFNFKKRLGCKSCEKLVIRG